MQVTIWNKNIGRRAHHDYISRSTVGKEYGLVAAIGLMLTIVIPVALIGIDSANEYNPTWGPLNNIVNFLQDIATVFTVVLLMKLFGADDKPVFRVMSMIMIAVGTRWAVRDLAPTAEPQSV